LLLYISSFSCWFCYHLSTDFFIIYHRLSPFSRCIFESPRFNLLKSKTKIMKNPNELTIENSVLVLIDHQPWVAFAVTSIDRGLMVNNTAALAQAARDLDVPVVLTTVGAKGSILVDPIFKEISDLFPDITPIDRTSTHAWSHPEVRAAIDATGRKKLIMAGLVTEVCLAQSVLAALKDGFDVFFVSDCSGGITPEAHEDAKVRMVQAGAKPISWIAVISEWAPDYTSQERAALADVTRQRGGSAALLYDYVIAQVTAGLVPPPSFMSAPVEKGSNGRPSRTKQATE
jgi:nicotinamidase-related amidase